MRKIQSCSNGRSVPIGNGAELIFRKCITIECHPIAKPRQTIRPVHTGTTVAGILRTAWQSIASRKETMSKGRKRQRHAGATHDRGTGKSKFEIPAGLEAKSLPMDERLRLKFHTKTARRNEVWAGSKLVPAQLSEEGFHTQRP